MMKGQDIGIDVPGTDYSINVYLNSAEISVYNDEISQGNRYKLGNLAPEDTRTD